MCEQEKETYPEFREAIRQIVDKDFTNRLADYTDVDWVDREQVVRVAVELFEATKEELVQEGMPQPRVLIAVDEEDMQSARLTIEIGGICPLIEFGLDVGDPPGTHTKQQCHVVRYTTIPGGGPERPFAETLDHKDVLAEGIIQSQLLYLLRYVRANMGIAQAEE